MIKTNKILFFILFINLLAYGQEKRTFSYGKNEVEYYLISNMTPSFTKYPNHRAKFIISKGENDLLELSKKHKVENDPKLVNDRTLYYYLKLPQLGNQGELIQFLEEFITDTYNRDFFDRNTTTIDFKDSEPPFICTSLEPLNVYFSSIVVPQKSTLLECGKPFVLTHDTKHGNLKTSTSYEPITINNSERKREAYKVTSQLHNWEDNFFLVLSFGNHSIDKKFHTSFDEETLVDVNEISAIWHLTSGYMFTKKVGALINFSLMTSKEQTRNSNGISISGSGNGFGIFQLGIGARYIPFTSKSWSIYTDVHGGFLNARAKGGSGSVTITNGGISSTTDISEKTEKSHYLGLVLGTSYRLGGLVFLTGNFQYTNSNFKNSIGSISGFTGYTINLGVGFSFK